MPHIRVNGVNLYYEDSGGTGEPIVFSHGLLWSGKMFCAQVAALKDRYRVITYDHRGQGQSEVAPDGYDMETLYQDCLALIDALKIAPCHFAGLSMGGFMGLRIAARRPDLLRSLILIETTSDPEPTENLGRYRLLNLIARWIGFGPVTNPVMKIMFGQKFLNDPARTVEREEMKQWLHANNRVGVTRAVMGVITRQGVYDEIDKITVPTLIMVGDQDVATVPAKSERMHVKIKGSKLVIVPGGGHSSTVEEPAFINQTISDFLNSLKS
jgi:3-oxoadipate enol-lactonase